MTTTDKQIKAATWKLIDAINTLADSENSEGCTDDLTVIDMGAFTALIECKRNLQNLLKG